MAEISRRHMLMAGGALGAAGALATATATPAWAWSSAGSIAGSGYGVDPHYVWDDEADALAAALITRGDVPMVNSLLSTWKYNGQPLPDGLPADLHAFIEKARQLPSWVEPAKLQTVTGFTKKRGNYLGVLYGLGSGMMSTAIPKEARAVYYSKGGADLKDRIAKTAKLGYDIGGLQAYQPGGEMIVTTVKTRLVHAAVRHLLPQSPGWSATGGGHIPISQADMLVTWHSLPTYCMRTMKSWGLSIPKAESDSFLHLWQVSAHMLGIKDEYIPGTWDAANAQSDQLLKPALGPTPEGIELADLLLSLATEIDHGVTKPFLSAMTRYLVGDQVADWVEIDRQLLWDRMVRIYWPQYVASREAFMPLPLAPEISWTFDEFLRLGVLFFLSEGKPISITIPDANRPG